MDTNPALPEQLQVIQALADAFGRLGISYLIGGSVASSAVGIERATQDIDLVVVLQAAQADALVAELGDAFYADADLLRDAIQNRSSANVIHLETMIKADLFVAPDTPFARSEMSRRIALPLLGDSHPPVYIASAEDMILQKLRWFRLTGERSERQWSDVQGMLRVQGDALDFDYLRHWAPELGIDDLYAQALSDAGISGQ